MQASMWAMTMGPHGVERALTKSGGPSRRRQARRESLRQTLRNWNQPPPTHPAPALTLPRPPDNHRMYYCIYMNDTNRNEFLFLLEFILTIFVLYNYKNTMLAILS